MSLRAEALRFALRHFSKGNGNGPVDIAASRASLDRMSRIIPRPPRGTVIDRLDAGGVTALRAVGPKVRNGCHVLYLHGGAYAYGSPSVYRDAIWRMAHATAAAVLCIDYRLAPEHPFPAGLDDAVHAYRWLLSQGADPMRIALMGDSAGGGLAYATLLRLRDEGAPLPAAAVGLSPWTDLTLSGESIRRNAEADPMLNAGQARFLADCYLGGADPKNPYASPLFGDFTGLPPSLIQVGDDEILLDDAVRLADGMRRAGCKAELELWPRMPHVWQMYAAFLPEGRKAIARIGRFVRQHTDSG